MAKMIVPARFIWTAILILAVGCAPTPAPKGLSGFAFSPLPDDARYPTTVQYVWSQADPPVAFRTATAFQTTTSGNTLTEFLIVTVFNAISAGVAAEATESRTQEARALAAALAGKGYGAALRDKLVASTSVAMKRSSWMKGTTPTVTDMAQGGEPETDAERNRLWLSGSFTMTNDACCLAARVDVKYLRPSRRLPAYSKSLLYISDPVGRERGMAAVAQWNAEGGAMMNRKIDEATRELTTMIERDFFSPDYAEFDREAKRVKLTYKSPSDNSVHSVSGFVVATSGDRIVLRYADTSLLSVVAVSVVPDNGR